MSAERRTYPLLAASLLGMAKGFFSGAVVIACFGQEGWPLVVFMTAALVYAWYDHR